MPEEKCVNGVNVTRLADTIKAIRQDPEIARFKLRAENKWVDGAHAFTVIKDFYGAKQEDNSRPMPFIFEADEPDVLLGNDYGPNATEALLHALACCLNATLIYHAATKGIPINGLEFDLEGNLDIQGFLGINEQVRNGFQNIRVNVRIDSDAPQNKLLELVELAQKRSPVFDMVSHGVPIDVRLESREAAPAM